jgi:nicotinamidase-related amidase
MTDVIPAIDPQRSALLVMDYQPAVLASLSEAEALLARLAAAIATVRQAGAHVAYVWVAFDDPDYETIPATNKAFTPFAASGRFLYHEAPETAVHHRVAPEPGDIIVRKTRVGAFSTTDLDEQLRSRDIDTVILAGVSTSGVVLSTVRDAADRDYRVYVLGRQRRPRQRRSRRSHPKGIPPASPRHQRRRPPWPALDGRGDLSAGWEAYGRDCRSSADQPVNHDDVHARECGGNGDDASARSEDSRREPGCRPLDCGGRPRHACQPARGSPNPSQAARPNLRRRWS